MNRRKFLKNSAIAAAGLTIMPSEVLGKSISGKTAPSDKL
ncbi:MAG: twin-arginine translocation signal domain-containing protein, partial [Dysgonamonadaceae bacterium]|nr:twin-arginine translocation signal domain-containing protein [Dysgonamonadaceae bacterium]